MTASIKFYGVGGDYGCFSNFSRHTVKLGGKTWPTSEHYFQAQKFKDPALREKIRRASTPSIAAHFGRDRKNPLRVDWESVKVAIMTEVVRAKFMQHADVRATLLSTGDAQLIEHTENDSYWADGGDGRGKNMLGVVLMRVREELLVGKGR